MELSPQIQKEAKKYNVPVAYLVLADLKHLGYSDSDAYAIAYPENATLSAQQNRSIMDTTLSSQKFKTLLQARMEKHGNTDMVMTGDDELLSKEDTARMIMTAAMAQPRDSKERIEGLMKYSDLMGYKKEDAEGDLTEDIRFFLPLKCNQCPLYYAYNDFLRKNGEREIRPVEMEHVMNVSHKLIAAAQAAE